MGAYRGVSAQERINGRKQQFLAAGKTVFGTLGLQAGQRKRCLRRGGIDRALLLRSLRQSAETVRSRVPSGGRSATTGPRRSRFAVTSGFPRSAAFDDSLLLRAARERPASRTNTHTGNLWRGPAISNLYEYSVRQFATRIEKLVAAPDAEFGPQLNSKLVAVALVGATSGLAMHWRLGGYKEPVSVMTDNCFAIFAGVLRKA